jgi:cytosine deaminase
MKRSFGVAMAATVASAVVPTSEAEMLAVAIEEARLGLAEGGVPCGAALFLRDGTLLGRGRNRRVQENDPSVHGETDAFRRAGRRPGYRDTILVTTLAPCWYCSGLIRQFGIVRVVVGESVNDRGGIDWLREHGHEVVDLRSQECIELHAAFIRDQPELWFEGSGADQEGSAR